MSDRDSNRRSRGVMRSFVVGGLVGAAAAVAAPRLRRSRAASPAGRTVSGLDAFEGAPCWQHDREQEADAAAAGE